MSDIFLSYNKQDREKVGTIVLALEREGWNVFWDPEILAGVNWREKLKCEIDSARCVVVIWSAASENSQWVLDEAELGRDRHILVPVRLDASKPPIGFRGVQAANLADWDGQEEHRGIRNLKESIRQILNPPKLIEKDPTKAATEAQLQSHSLPLPVSKRFFRIQLILEFISTRIGVFLTLLAAFVVVGLPAYLYFQKPNPGRVGTIAVLPLRGTDPKETYLSTGLTQVLTNCLSQLPGVKVVSYNSVRRLAAAELDFDLLRSSLRVDAVIRGRLSQIGDSSLLQLELVDLRTQESRWHDTYGDMNVSNFAPRLAMDIAAQLDVPIDTFLTRQFQRFSTRDKSAFDSYLRGLFEALKGTAHSRSVALEHLRSAVDRDPAFVPAYNYLAHVLETVFELGGEKDQKLLEEAATYCAKSLSVDSLNGDAMAILGVIETMKGNSLAGKTLSGKALLLDPNNPIALTNLGLLETYDFQNPAKGVAHFALLRDLQPLDYFVHCNLGVAYAMMMDFPDAYVSFQQALKLDPTKREIWLNLARYYTHEAKIDSAVLCYEHLLRLNELDETANERLGALYIATNRIEQAESLLTIATGRLQSNYTLLYLLGRTRSFRHRENEAQNKLQQGLLLVEAQLLKSPDNSELIAMKGLFEAHLHRGAEARTSARKAVTIDTTNSETFVRVAQIYAALGNKIAMIESFRRARRDNNEYDVAYLRTAFDFLNFRTDMNLEAIARGGN